MPTLQQRTQSLTPGKLYQLFAADIKNGPTYYFHNQTGEPGLGGVTFQGLDYVAWPIKAEGWDYNTEGPQARPTLTLSDFDSTITALMIAFDNLIGTVVTRRRTFQEYLDDWPGADESQEYTPDIYVVDSAPMVVPGVEIQFELINPVDNENIFLPNRQVKSNACDWSFRGPDCGYTGIPKQKRMPDGSIDNITTATVDRGAYNANTVYAVNHVAYTTSSGMRLYWLSRLNNNTRPLTDINAWLLTVCDKTLSACKLHHGANTALPFGGFPGAGRTPSG